MCSQFINWIKKSINSELNNYDNILYSNIRIITRQESKWYIFFLFFYTANERSWSSRIIDCPTPLHAEKEIHTVQHRWLLWKIVWIQTNEENFVHNALTRNPRARSNPHYCLNAHSKPMTTNIYQGKMPKIITCMTCEHLRRFLRLSGADVQCGVRQNCRRNSDPLQPGVGSGVCESFNGLRRVLAGCNVVMSTVKQNKQKSYTYIYIYIICNIIECTGQVDCTRAHTLPHTVSSTPSNVNSIFSRFFRSVWTHDNIRGQQKDRPYTCEKSKRGDVLTTDITTNYI